MYSSYKLSLSDEGERKVRSISLLTEEQTNARKKLGDKNERKKEREKKKRIEFYDGDDG